MEEKKESQITEEELTKKLKQVVDIKLTFSDVLDIRDSLLTRLNFTGAVIGCFGGENQQLINNNTKIVKLLNKITNFINAEIAKTVTEKVEEDVKEEKNDIEGVVN